MIATARMPGLEPAQTAGSGAGGTDGRSRFAPWRWMPRLTAPAIVARRGVVVAVNEAVLRLLDATRNQLLGRPLHTLLHGHHGGPSARRPDDHRRHLARIFSAGGRCTPVEARSVAVRRGLELILLLDPLAPWHRHVELLRRQAALQTRAAGLAADHERHRRHAARALHDHVQQNLAAVDLHLRAVQQAVEAARPGAAAVLDRATHSVARALETARHLAEELSPSLVDELGLVPALEGLVARCAAAQAAALRRDWARGEERAAGLDRSRALVLYRAAEAVLAGLGTKGTAVLADHGASGLALLIAHDGRVPDANAAPLAALRDWARELGGDLVVDAPPDGGVRLMVHVDLAVDVPAARTADPDEAALLRLFYRLPVGIVQTDADGRVQLMNPRAARLLLPLVHPQGVDNLFDALRGLWPGLRAQLDTADAPVARLQREGCVPVRLRLHREASGWLAVLGDDEA